jgi:hypothetical protein
MLQLPSLQESTQRTRLGKIIVALQAASDTVFTLRADLGILDFELGLVGGQRSSIRVVVRMILGRKERREVLDEESLV